MWVAAPCETPKQKGETSPALSGSFSVSTRLGPPWRARSKWPVSLLGRALAALWVGIVPKVRWPFNQTWVHCGI